MNSLTIWKLMDKGVPFTENIGLYLFTAIIQIGNAMKFIGPVLIAWLIVRALKKNK